MMRFFLLILSCIALASASATIYAAGALKGGSVTTNSQYTSPANVLFSSGLASGSASILNSGSSAYAISPAGSGPAQVGASGSYTATGCNGMLAALVSFRRTDGVVIGYENFASGSGTFNFASNADLAATSAAYEIVAYTSSSACSITISNAIVSVIIPLNL